jgi:hypothetical protein
MQVGSIVECIKGHPDVIEEGQYYTVRDLKNGVFLYEVSPPEPYTSFLKERFKEVQSPDEVTEIFFDLLADQLEK